MAIGGRVFWEMVGAIREYQAARRIVEAKLPCRALEIAEEVRKAKAARIRMEDAVMKWDIPKQKGV